MNFEDCSFHDLRHSAATILLAMNVHPKVVQEILGHSQIAMTLDVYSHIPPSMQEEVTKQWDSEFGQQVKKRKNYTGYHSTKWGF
jgi:integrase